MKKRLWSGWTAVLLSLSMLLTCLPLTALASGDPVSVGTWAALKEAMRTGGDIVLTADVADPDAKAPDTDNGYLLVPEGVTVTLDLAGHAVDRAMGDTEGEEYKGCVIHVQKDATLTIKDSSGNDSGKITGGYSKSAGGVYVNGGTLILEGGSITGNRSSEHGGGLKLDETSFVMSGGKISGNTAVWDGGGVWQPGWPKGTFAMSGGKISGNRAGGSGGGMWCSTPFTISGGEILNNTAKTGGGICHQSSDAEMSGGRIAGNSAENGGGLGHFSSGTFTLSNGTIEDNTAIYLGGGVSNGAGFIMTGGIISGNKTRAQEGDSFGGGLYNGDGGASSFTMSGGEISGNSARMGGGVCTNGNYSNVVIDSGKISRNRAEYGGGVWADSNSCKINGGEISDNIASVSGGGVYHTYGSVTMSDGEITGNNAAQKGGGVSSDYSYSQNRQTFIMDGGKISANVAQEGGGVYYECEDVQDGNFNFEGPNITLSGGEITGNEATQNGGGVFVATDSFILSGPASVTGNRRGDAENNVYLKDKNLIRVGGALDGASVGVSTDDPEGRGIFTASYKSAGNAENPASAFPSDNDLYIADFSADGNEAELYRTIRKQDIALSDADGAPVTNATYVYDGAAKTPAVKATWSGETLTENTDYTVSYADNVNASDAACVTLTGKGAYRGAVTVNFTIGKAPIAPTVALDGWTYGETAKTPSVTGNPGAGAVTYSYAPAGSASFSATVPTNAGTYAVKAVVAETDNYQSGEASAEFTIDKAQIAPSVNVDGWAFGAAPNAPVVTGNLGNGAVTYSYAPAGSDDFSETVPTQPGTYAVKASVAETANYQSGEASGEFAIEPLAVKEVTPDGGKVTAEVACGLSDASVYCAVYDASGAMIAMSVKPVSGADAYEFQFDGAAFDYAKVFLLDADLNPLCEAKRS